LRRVFCCARSDSASRWAKLSPSAASSADRRPLLQIAASSADFCGVDPHHLGGNTVANLRRSTSCPSCKLRRGVSGEWNPYAGNETTLENRVSLYHGPRLSLAGRLARTSTWPSL